MKIIKPSFEIYNIPDATDHDAVLMHIEKIGRTCYKSEDKITPTSCIKFIENIRNRKHWAVLEHYIFTVSVPEWLYDELQTLNKDVVSAEDSNLILKLGFIHSTYWKKTRRKRMKYLVSFSATALNNLMLSEYFKKNKCSAICHLFAFMNNKYPELMYCPYDIRDSYDSEISFLTRAEIKSLPKWLREIHDFMSVLFVVDRGITHEIVRHRPASFAQESTRYCNYSQGKFCNEIAVILPSFFDTGMGEMSNSLVYDEWKVSCESAEYHYLKLLEMGATPQQARSVLPNSLKADLNMTATLNEFNHFFSVRCTKAAHPQVREVACPLMEEANNSEYYNGMFNDNIHLVEKYKEEIND